jgi:type I restriction enzyme, S subunit
MSSISHYSALTSLLETIVDNRGKTVPASDVGFPLIATNCIKHSSLYPTLENLRYVSEEVKKSWFRAHPEPNDIIFVNKGTPGRVCLVPNPVPFCIAQDMVAFRCNQSRIDYRYLFAVLRSSYIQQTVENYHVGLVIPHFKKSDLGSIRIPRLENKALESAVGKLYVDLSKKIELNNKINAELEAMAKLIYDYWFVQFDFPDANGRPYKSSGGKMVYNATLRREIPDGWNSGVLSDISALVRGVTYSKGDICKENDPDVVPILRATNISGSEINLENMVYIPEEFVSKKQILSEYDVLITMSSGSKDHIGKNGLYYFDDRVSFGAFCAKLVAKEGFRYYLYAYTQSDFMFTTIKNECLGTNINNLNGSLVCGFRIAIPEAKILELYNQQMKEIYEKVGVNQKENRMLLELRDWLLPMLVSGQVTVRGSK